MLIFSDEDVPEPIAKFLEARGHTVERTRDRVLQGAADQTIASLASDESADVVTFNFGHFTGHAQHDFLTGNLHIQVFA